MCPRLQAALDPSCHGMVSRVWAPPARHLRWIQDKAQDRQGARARRQECAPGRRRRRRRRIKRRERVREGARKSEQERSAALLCLRSGHQPPPPALVSGPTSTQAFQAEGPRVANKQASKEAPCNSTKYKSWTALLRKPHHSSSLAADKIETKCQTLKACCRHTAENSQDSSDS